jgi:hypothetical protein
VAKNEFRTLIAEPIHFATNIDLHRTTKRNRKLAREAYEQYVAHAPDIVFSDHFADGFIEGHADYLTFGGDGTPPLAPPRRYWKLAHRDVDGQVAVEEWFLGFAAGAEDARASGVRDWQTVASSNWSAPAGAAMPIEANAPDDESFEPIPAPREPLEPLPEPTIPAADATSFWPRDEHGDDERGYVAPAGWEAPFAPDRQAGPPHPLH